jgi:hypothetical protein
MHEIPNVIDTMSRRRRGKATIRKKVAQGIAAEMNGGSAANVLAEFAKRPSISAIIIPGRFGHSRIHPSRFSTRNKIHAYGANVAAITSKIVTAPFFALGRCSVGLCNVRTVAE